ncbi:very short patch repair endonuclease [Aliiroseovarius sp. CAU 1755]
MPKSRSEIMASIRAKDTKPELTVRRALHKRGFRFRLHGKDLAGKPDIVLPKFKSVIFVNGCFWHAHSDCPYFRIPKTQTEFWQRKLLGNAARDKRNIATLAEQGWRSLVVWECATRQLDAEIIAEKIAFWLRNGGQSGSLEAVS